MAVKTKKAFAKFPSTCGFVVKRLRNPEKHASRNGELSLKLTEINLIWVNLETGR